MSAESQRWRSTRLKFLADLKSGSGITSADITDDGEYPVYGGNGFRGYASAYTHNGDYALIGRQGALCGNVHRTSGKFWASEHAVVASMLGDTDAGWYSYLTQSMNLGQYSVSAAQPGLAVDRIRELPVQAPLASTQKAIADYLDEKTAAIDTLIEKKRKFLDLLAEERAALINQAVTKGLDPTVPMKDSGVPWIGEIPAHWEVRPSRYLVDESRPIMYGIVLPGPHVEDGVPVVKANNCRPGRLDPSLMKRTTKEIESCYVRSRLRAEDVVIAIRGSVGSAEVVPASLVGANLTQDAARLSPSRKLTTSWLHLLTQSAWFEGYLTPRITGATVKGINIWDLSRVPLPDVPVAEQERISTAIHDRIQHLDGVKLSESVDRLQEYRQSLITAAVTGQLDIEAAT